MNLKRCKNGHFYDGDKNDACPNCYNNLSSNFFNEVVTDNNFFEKEITNNEQWRYLQKIKNELLKIDHDNIVKIYDIYSFAGNNYIKEEFIHGQTLENMIKNKKISLEIFLNIGISICDALNYLYKRDMVYMDIKPSNIIYNEDNKKVTLIDIDSIYSKKIACKINYFGTIEYSSPEQIMYSRYDIQGSVYSLGLVFYKMLTGKLPFNVSRSGMKDKIVGKIELDFDLACDFRIKSKITELIKKMILSNEDERIKLKAINRVLCSIEKKANMEELQEIIITNKEKFEQDKITDTKFQDDFTYANYDHTFDFQAPDINSVNDNINNRDMTYRNELLKEYNSILIQTKVLFWCWLSAVLMCYVIAGFCLYLILDKRFVDSACSLVLEGLVYAVQRIFSIREDHYRELINNKIVHLQKGDFIEYAISKMEVINDINEKDKKVMEIIDDIRKICD